LEGSTSWASSRVVKCKGSCEEELWPYDQYEIIPDEIKIKELDKNAYK